ncbi:MAG: DUF2530 domain-containing protein [Dermatophilaceae bacterium]
MARLPRSQRLPDPEPLRWPLSHTLLPLLVVWAVALAVVLAVPDLHTGERSWWPWTCVAALLLGGLGYGYIRRGRGNAESA